MSTIAIPQLTPQFVIDNAGKRKAVILSIDDYNKLIEDLENLTIVLRQKDKSMIPYEDGLCEIEHEPPKDYIKRRTPGLSRGDFFISKDFNDPLPDSFWLGEEDG